MEDASKIKMSETQNPKISDEIMFRKDGGPNNIKYSIIQRWNDPKTGTDFFLDIPQYDIYEGKIYTKNRVIDDNYIENFLKMLINQRERFSRLPTDQQEKLRKLWQQKRNLSEIDDYRLIFEQEQLAQQFEEAKRKLEEERQKPTQQ